MANLLPAAAARNFQVNANDVDAINANQIPTNQQLVHETNRYKEFQRHQDQMSVDEYGVSIRADHELGNTVAAVMAEIQAMRAAMTTGFNGVDARLNGIDTRLNGMDARLDGMDARFDGMDARFDGINARLVAMDAKTEAGHARFVNSITHDPTGTLEFRPLVKYIPGHPMGLAPRLNDVLNDQQPIQFDAEYPVGSMPPDGLIPSTFFQVRSMEDGNPARLRRRLKAIYWFYNDPRLDLDTYPNGRSCLKALEFFLKYP